MTVKIISKEIWVAAKALGIMPESGYALSDESCCNLNMPVENTASEHFIFTHSEESSE